MPENKEENLETSDIVCLECHHDEKLHLVEDGWIYCTHDKCNCGNNIGR